MYLYENENRVRAYRKHVQTYQSLRYFVGSSSSSSGSSCTSSRWIVYLLTVATTPPLKPTIITPNNRCTKRVEVYIYFINTIFNEKKKNKTSRILERVSSSIHRRQYATRRCNGTVAATIDWCNVRAVSRSPPLERGALETGIPVWRRPPRYALGSVFAHGRMLSSSRRTHYRNGNGDRSNFFRRRFSRFRSEEGRKYTFQWREGLDGREDC